MALPKTVKYLLCYLPFILIGTGLVVFGVFENGSARIASLIVGVVVLFSGLFAWCTDSDVGCLVVCSCWSNKERNKSKKSSKSTVQANQTVEIFTIHNSRAVVESPQTTTASKTTKKVSQEEAGSGKEEDFREGKMIQRDRYNHYGKHSLHTTMHKVAFDDEHPHVGGGGGGGGRKPRFPTRAPSLDNHLNTYKPNGIHGRQEMRLTVRNLQKLDKMRQHHNSMDSDRMHEAHMYSTTMMNNEGFEVEIGLSIQKQESIKNWISDVHNSREDVGMMNESPTPPLGAKWGVSNGYDSAKIKRKPLPAVPPRDHSSSLASGSGIDIEVHSLPRSFGSDGNKSANGTMGSPEPPETPTIHEYDLSGYLGKKPVSFVYR